jgi:hypothetical protein
MIERDLQTIDLLDGPIDEPLAGSRRTGGHER